MTDKFKVGVKYVLMGVYLLAIAALLILALDQASRMLRFGAVPALQHLNMGLLGYAMAIAAVATALFALVFRHPRRLLAVSLVVILAFVGLNLYSGRHALPQVLIGPTPVTLSEQYVQALVADDLQAALRLTNQSEACGKIMTQVFQDHQSQLVQALDDGWQDAGFLETSVKSIATVYDGHVPRQLVIIMVETEDGKNAWLNLGMRYGPFLGTRYICGKSIDS